MNPGGGESSRIEIDLERLYAVEVPPLPWSPHAAPPDTATGAVSPRRRRMVLVLGAIVIAAAVSVVLPAAWRGEDEVDADEIIQRARAAIFEPPREPYRLVQVSRYADEQGDHLERREVWYRDEDHHRFESTETVNGDAFARGAFVSGDDQWFYSTGDGDTTAVHSGPAGPLHAGAELVGAGLTDALAQYNSDESCMRASLLGEEPVLGRNTYLVAVVAAPETCSRTDSLKTAMVENARRGWRSLHWIDAETFITLRSHSKFGGVTVSTTEATLFETGGEFPDSFFVYHPPDGVTVHDLITIDDLCKALPPVGCGAPRTPPPRPEGPP